MVTVELIASVVDKVGEVDTVIVLLVLLGNVADGEALT